MKPIFLVAIVILTALLTCTSVLPMSAQGTTSPVCKKGINVQYYGNDPNSEEISGLLMDRLVQIDGLCSIAITFPLYHVGKEVLRGEATPTDRRLGHLITAAHEREFTVSLKILIQEDRARYQWRGVIDYQNPRDLQTWFDSYRDRLVEYGQFAQDYGVEMFNIGTELMALEKYTTQWLELIAAVRSVYSGEVTYAMNWWPGGYVPGFVTALDFFSVDAFYELDTEGGTVESLIYAWSAWNKEIRRFQNTGVPFVFAEVGAVPRVGSHRQPWNGNPPNRAFDVEAQRLYYAATCRVAFEAGAVGIYWWAVDFYSFMFDHSQSTDFNPTDKPAESEIEICFTQVYS